MNTLWKHQTQHTGSVNQILGVYHNDVVHYLSLNAQQQPLSYEITKHPAQLQTNITLAFQPSMNPQPLPTDSAQHHLAEGLFPIANTYANHKECVSVLWFHEQTAIVFAFRNGELIFANRYPSSNTQEHLYYALLPFHENKLNPHQFGLFVLCDATQHASTAQLFQKFIPHAEVTAPHLPWIANTPAPLQHIVSPLIKLASCVSPADI